jgi:LEA14-like dessication related protein
MALLACSKPSPPTITPERAEVVATNPAGLLIRVHCVAHNPNSIPLPIRRVDGNITMGGAPLGGVSASSMTTLAAKADTPTAFDLNVPWANVAATVLSTMGSTQDLPYTVQGTAHFEAAGIEFSVPFTTQGTLRRSDLIGGAARSVPIPRLPGMLPKFP